MKAAVHTRYGSPDVVHVEDVPIPTPDAGEVLVKVHATTVNRTDCGVRAAHPFFIRVMTGLVRPKMTILGNEFAGETEAVGSGVTGFEAGDRVFGYIEDRPGAHAQYLTIPADGSIAHIPDNTGYPEIAPATDGSHYALNYIRAGDIGAGDRVIDDTAQDFTEDAETYDVVFDAVGKSSFGRCRKLLNPGGIYFSTDPGPFWQSSLLAAITPRLGGRKIMFPIPTHDQEMIDHFRELIEAGDFTPLVDRRYPLDEIVEAYQYVETGHKVGNVVIVVESDGEAG